MSGFCDIILLFRRPVMKHCPTCSRTYNDNTLNFCLEDGEWLVDGTPGSSTAILPADYTGESPTRQQSILERPTEISRSPDTLSPVVSDSSNANNRPRLFIVGLLGVIAILAVSLTAYWYLTSTEKPASPISVSRPTQVTTWSGLDLFPSLSGDGRMVAFSSDRTGNFEIYVKQLVNGARDVQVTSDGNQNLQPTISPDGSFIAFHSKKRGGIWIIPSTGGTAKQLSEFGSAPAFSPDGSQIAFQSDPLNDLSSNVRNALPPSVIWTVPAIGGEPKQLTKKGEPAGGHGHPSWSPDGKRLVFDVSDWASARLACLDVESSAVTQLPIADGPVSDPIFSADGNFVYFSANMNSTLQSVRIDGCEIKGEPEDLFDSSGPRIRQMTLDRSGKRIVYTTLETTSNIWRTRLTAPGVAEPEQLTRDAHTRTVYPTFSPDGRRIAFQKFSAGNISHIWLINSDGSNEEQIGSRPSLSTAWARDGSRIWFVSVDESNTSMWYISPENSSEKKAFDFGEEVFIARPSPDGKWIAFQSKRTGTTNVFLRSVESGETKQLTFDEEFAGFPAWSPDGRWLALQLKRGEDSFVAVVSADGGPITQLTTEHGQSWVSDYSANGDEIVFAGQREGLWNLYSVSRTTGKQRKLTNFTKLNTYVRYPVWSPANDQIAFEFAETTGNIWMVEFK